MKKKILATAVLIVTMFTTIACGGEKDELSQYKSEVDSFYKTISQCDTKINKIDSSSANASTELLKELDILNQAFKDFAAAPVPYEFAAVESLADEASEYMNEAVELYHEAFETDPFDEFTAGIAQQKYNRAIVRVNYIGQILQGKELSGEGISTYTEDLETGEIIKENSEPENQ